MNHHKNGLFKLIFSFLIGCSIQNNIIFGMALGLGPDFTLKDSLLNENSEQKPVIIFDLDDTLIDIDMWKAVPYYFWAALPSNVGTLAFLKSKRIICSDGTKRYPAKNSKDLAPGGAATSFGFYGLYGNDSEDFQKLVPEILDITWQNARFIPGIKTLLDHLQQKRYPIIYATNKDYTSYKHVAETMDKKYNNAFSKYPKFILVTQPDKKKLDRWLDDANKNKVSARFHSLIEEIHDAKEDESKRIYFAGGHEKPEAAYYEKLNELMMKYSLDKNKLIFFDDKQINITSARSHGIDGYTIKTVADIVTGLEQEGIIDPKAESDKDLYMQLAKEGVFGFIKQITSYTAKNPTKQKSNLLNSLLKIFAQ
jgi:FMN phosphatase YigB (HAD superfamily)